MLLDDLMLSRSPLDRRSVERGRPGLIDDAWADPATRVLRWSDGRSPISAEGPRSTGPDGPGNVGARGLDLVAPTAVEQTDLRVFLGREVDGTVHLAARIAHEHTSGDGWEDLRVAAPTLSERDTGLLTAATAVLRWHQGHTHCPRCGAATVVEQAGWVRRCPVDESTHFPRTDPAVIMAVVDDEDRILLGHNPAWPDGRYSTLAGFIEPGETLEQAVRREVAEETGVVVGEVTYRGDQPWPFPASLMLGFTARAISCAVDTDGHEITDARWFSRAELAAATSREGVILPGPVSISHRLIESWYGEPLPTAGEWR